MPFKPWICPTPALPTCLVSPKQQIVAEPKPQPPMKNVGPAPTDLNVPCVEEEKDTIERWEGALPGDGWIQLKQKIRH